MKLYTRQEFLALPAGVVFAKYQPCCFDQWQIKGDTLPYNDFYTQDFAEIDSSTFDEHIFACLAFESVGEAAIDFYSCGRDGLYEDDMLFAVLEKYEVRDLIERLEQTLVDGYADTIS